MSMLFAYMDGGEGVGDVLKCFVRGGQNFFLLACACVCVCGGAGEGVRVSSSLSGKK